MMIKMIKMLAFHCYNSKKPFSNMNSQTNVNVAFGYFFLLLVCFGLFIHVKIIGEQVSFSFLPKLRPASVHTLKGCMWAEFLLKPWEIYSS